MISDREYIIESGIKKEKLNMLNQYLLYIEEHGIRESKELSKIIDEFFQSLYEPRSIEKEEKNIIDLAFIYDNNKIIGHYVHQIIVEQTIFGYKKKSHLLEEYALEPISEEYREQYILERLQGKLETRVVKNEKNNQK